MFSSATIANVNDKEVTKRRMEVLSGRRNILMVVSSTSMAASRGVIPD